VRLGWLPEQPGKNDSGADSPRARLLSNKQDAPLGGSSGHAAAADALQHESAAQDAATGQESAPMDVSEQQDAQPAAAQQDSAAGDAALAQQQAAGAAGQDAAPADSQQTPAEQPDQESSFPATAQGETPATQDAVPAQLDAAEAIADVSAQQAASAALDAQPATPQQASPAEDSAAAEQQAQPAAAEQEPTPATGSNAEQNPAAAEQEAQPSPQAVPVAETAEATDASQQAATPRPSVWSSYRELPNVHEAHPIECAPLRSPHPLLGFGHTAVCITGGAYGTDDCAAMAASQRPSACTPAEPIHRHRVAQVSHPCIDRHATAQAIGQQWQPAQQSVLHLRKREDRERRRLLLSPGRPAAAARRPDTVRLCLLPAPCAASHWPAQACQLLRLRWFSDASICEHRSDQT